MLLILSNVCAKKIIQGIISNTYQQSTIFECATNHDIQNIIIQCRIDGHLFQGIERPEIFLLGKAIMTNYQKVWQQGPMSIMRLVIISPVKNSISSC